MIILNLFLIMMGMRGYHHLIVIIKINLKIIVCKNLFFYLIKYLFK